jgi:hypothetical protein
MLSFCQGRFAGFPFSKFCFQPGEVFSEQTDIYRLSSGDIACANSSFFKRCSSSRILDGSVSLSLQAVYKIISL